MEKIDYWSIAFTVFFVFLIIVGYALVWRYGPPYSIPWWDALILALAAFRLTRLVVYDNITQWFRDLVEAAEPRTFLGTVKALVNCPWCTGLWFALVVSVMYFAWPETWFALFVLALGAVASFMQITSNLVGWHAEYKKIETTQKQGDLNG